MKNLGRGWAFPIHIDGRGKIAMVEGEKDIEQSIYIILNTRRGERIMRPEFGSNVRDVLQEPIPDQETAGLVDFEVREALARCEPRIEVLRTKIVQKEATIGVEIEYRLNETGEVRNKVFPLYNPAEEGV